MWHHASLVRRTSRLLLALGSESLFLDLPARVVRDVHRRVAAGAGEIGHGDAGEGLAARDARIFASAAGDDVRAAIHLGLRLVEITGVARTQAPSIYFLVPESTLSAVHRADILSNVFSPFMFSVVPTASSKVAAPRPGTSMLSSGRKMKCVT